LITAEIKNAKTLSELIAADQIDKNVWEAIGKCLSLFEEKRIYHPDLNTNNILIDESLEVFLIDFDAASRLHEKIGSSNKTLNRFHRSLKKTYLQNKKEFSESDWKIILSRYSID